MDHWVTKTPSWVTVLLWIRGLHNSMKLWAIPCRATQDGQAVMKFLTKCSPLLKWWRIPTPVFLSGEHHGQYEKAKKVWCRKINPPRWKVSNMLLGKSREQLLISSVRMKGLGQGRNDTQLWMYLSGGESKVQWYEEQYCIRTWNFRAMLVP